MTFCKRSLSIFLILLIVFVMMISVVVPASAIAPAIPAFVQGAGILAGILTAYGFSGLTAEDVQAVWDDLPDLIREGLILVGRQSVFQAGFGMVSAVIGPVLMSAIDEYFEEHLASGVIGGTSGFDLSAFRVRSYPNSVAIGNALPTVATAVLMAKVHELSESYNFVYVTLDYDALFSYVSSIDVHYANTASTYAYCDYYNDSPVLRVCEVSSPVFSHISLLRKNNDYSTLYWDFAYTSNSSGRLLRPQVYYYSNVPIPVYSGQSGGTLVGQLWHQSTAGYSYDNYYNPGNYPLTPGVDGDTNVTFPGVVAPDVNVNIPANSIGNPITLDTVLKGYESIDGFFDAGGTITLADGTRIGKLAEVSRANPVQWSDAVPQASAESFPYNIPVLGNILSALRAIYAGVMGIVAWLANFSLVDFFVLPDGYVTDNFDAIRREVPMLAFPQQIINDLHSMTSLGGDVLKDITINYRGQTHTVVSFQGLRDMLPTIHSWVRGIIFILLLFYNYNQIYKAIRGNSYGFGHHQSASVLTVSDVSRGGRNS